MTRLRPPTVLASIVLTLMVGTSLPVVAAVPDGAFGDPTAPLPERVTAAEQAEMQGFQMASTDDVKVFGGGWGHGIGMSQWGAKALADQGMSYTQILSHFYESAQFGKTTAEGGSIVQHGVYPFQVGIGPNKTSATFTPLGGPAQVCLGGSCHTAGAGESWSIVRLNGVCFLKKGTEEVAAVNCADAPTNSEGNATGHGEVFSTITWTNQPVTRVQFTSLSRTYGRGSVNFITAPAGRFHIRAALGLEEYLLGLGEVPNTWGPEALKAQVVAARTFALYRLWAVRNLAGGLLECSCQLRATTADQAYRGWEPNPSSAMTEGDPNNGAKWKNAVDVTSGEAMWHSFSGGDTRALEAYYFSSTGDRTENNQDRWGGTQYPYLKSTSDPGSTSWTKGFSHAEFAAKLGFHSVTWVEIDGRYDSGRPKKLIITGKVNGTTTVKEFTSLQFDTVLGLQAPWVNYIGGLLPPDADRVVLHNRSTGQWTYQKDGGLQFTIYFGNPGDYAFMGDWDGDGIDTPGLYRQSDGFVYLRNSNTQGNADITFYFGNPGDVPIVGDFNGDGHDTVSIYRPSQARFYIINKLGQNGGGLGAADHSFLFGNVGDAPFVGDWDGDGKDTPGLRRASDGFVYLRNSNTQGVADISFFYGNPGDYVFAGDWDGNDRDSIGLFRPSNATVYLRNALSTGVADFSFTMGGSNHRPVAGWGWN